MDAVASVALAEYVRRAALRGRRIVEEWRRRATTVANPTTQPGPTVQPELDPGQAPLAADPGDAPGARRRDAPIGLPAPPAATDGEDLRRRLERAEEQQQNAFYAWLQRLLDRVSEWVRSMRQAAAAVRDFFVDIGRKIRDYFRSFGG
jgi:hypothetical protein